MTLLDSLRKIFNSANLMDRTKELSNIIFCFFQHQFSMYFNLDLIIALATVKTRKMYSNFVIFSSLYNC